MAAKKYVAVVGCRNYFEPKLLRPGLILKLVKEPENLHDEEAIQVELAPFGKVGYVANSVHTVPRGCASAGRIMIPLLTLVTGWSGLWSATQPSWNWLSPCILRLLSMKT